MRNLRYRFVSAFVAVSMLTAPIAAQAQQAHPAAVAPAAPAAAQPATAPTTPAGAQQPNGEYAAPLSQTTQTTYVPQSVAMSGPATMDYSEDAPVPAGYHPETRLRKGLIIGGAITFGALYLISLLIAAGGSDVADSTGRKNEVAALYVPVFGPFIQMTQTSSSTANVFLAIDGLAQAGGAAMLIGGFVAPKHVLVRNDLGSVHVTPMRMGRDGMGLGLTGTF